MCMPQRYSGLFGRYNRRVSLFLGRFRCAGMWAVMQVVGEYESMRVSKMGQFFLIRFDVIVGAGVYIGLPAILVDHPCVRTEPCRVPSAHVVERDL